MGAGASIVVPWFADRYAAGADWYADFPALKRP